ncbi:hypothetical protein H4R35_005932 [Dimargaris xerosporica]|nr:hypothetical protein H4R35_005932 [Dimargaris xerosporica]
MSDSGNWCLIESDPGVFTELIGNMGVQGVQVEEVYSLDDASLSELSPVYGLVFLFKWQPNISSSPAPTTSTGIPDASDHVFFAKQVINNACATQAILSILLNTPQLELGSELQQFKEFTADFPSDLKGLAISNSEVIRSVHNSFARSDPFVSDERPAESDNDDVFHFISYVPVAGCLYELDGLKEIPVNVGPCTDANWLQKVRPVIQQRMATYVYVFTLLSYASSEIRFNLMAVMKSRKALYQERMATIQQDLNTIQAQIAGLQIASGKSTPVAAPSTPSSQPGGAHQGGVINELQAAATALEAERVQLSHKIMMEQSKLQRYKQENVLRKHNFIPFVYQLVRAIAKTGQLDPLIREARQRKRHRTD